METHSFDKHVACEVGIKCALVIGYIGYWCEKNREAERNLSDGRYWTYKSVKRLAEEDFPYMTEKEIRSAIDKLRTDGYVLSGKLGIDKKDNTMWYTLTQKGYDLLYTTQKVDDKKYMPKGQTACPTGQNAYTKGINDHAQKVYDPCTKSINHNKDTVQTSSETVQQQFSRACEDATPTIVVRVPDLPAEATVAPASDAVPAAADDVVITVEGIAYNKAGLWNLWKESYPDEQALILKQQTGKDLRELAAGAYTTFVSVPDCRIITRKELIQSLRWYAKRVESAPQESEVAIEIEGRAYTKQDVYSLWSRKAQGHRGLNLMRLAGNRLTVEQIMEGAFAYIVTSVSCSLNKETGLMWALEAYAKGLLSGEYPLPPSLGGEQRTERKTRPVTDLNRMHI